MAAGPGSREGTRPSCSRALTHPEARGRSAPRRRGRGSSGRAARMDRACAPDRSRIPFRSKAETPGLEGRSRRTRSAGPPCRRRGRAELGGSSNLDGECDPVPSNPPNFRSRASLAFQVHGAWTSSPRPAASGDPRAVRGSSPRQSAPGSRAGRRMDDSAARGSTSPRLDRIAPSLGAPSERTSSRRAAGLGSAPRSRPRHVPSGASPAMRRISTRRRCRRR